MPAPVRLNDRDRRGSVNPARIQRIVPVTDPAPERQRRRNPVISLCGAVAIVMAGYGASEAAGQAGPASWEDDLQPVTPADWDRGKAAHLLERAGFGGTPEEIDRLAAMSPEEAVRRLVDYASIPDRLPAFDASQIWTPGMDPFPKSRAEAVRIARETGEAMGVRVLPEGESRRLQPVVNQFFYGLRSNSYETQRLALWWGDRMVRTQRPLEEKLTLFWHGHFATGSSKVRDTRMMERQHLMLRSNAAATFRDLLLGILRDPASARLSGQWGERQGPPQREFWPGVAGVVHDGSGQLHGARSPGSLPCVHRLDQ